MSEPHPEPLTHPQRSSWHRWSWARAIATSRLPQASAIIPVVGYILLWSDQVFDFLKSVKLLGPTLLPPVLKLHMLYWGSILMTVGWLIYALRCPTVIKRHGSPEGYVVEQFQAPNHRRLATACTAVAELVEPYHPHNKDRLLFDGHSPHDARRATKGPFDSFVKRGHEVDLLFSLQWHLIDNARPVASFVSVLLLVVGAAMFLFPSGEVVVRVIWSIIT